MKPLLAQSHCRSGPGTAIADEPFRKAPGAFPDPQRSARAVLAVRRWALCLALVCAWSTLVSAQTYNLRTDYENYCFSPGLPTGPYTNYFDTNASTVVYGGNVLGNRTSTLPTGGQYGLAWSSFGQPAASVQSDVALGDYIAAPPGTDTNNAPWNFVAVRVGDNTNAYYECTDPQGGAFWVPSSGRIIAAQPNNITIDWRLLPVGTNTAGTNRQVLNVNAVPTQRPARLFWTENPYDAPAVSLSGLFPVIHYNTEVPAPVYTVTTTTNGGMTTSTTNIASGVWLDAQKQLHAKNVSGLIIVEYYQEGSYKQQVKPSGIEVVQVLEPNLQFVEADVGARLMPIDTYWANVDGINGILPNVTQGLNDTAYVNALTGPKDNWVFAIKRTWTEPWALEIYWQHTGCMGVLWPYEVDWYSCDWPQYPQHYLLGDAPPTDTAPVLIPSTLSAELMEDMDPPLHAKLSASGKSLNTTQPGHCLLKYTTSDDIWFEVVQTVSHTNNILFEIEPKEWPIGQELTPGSLETHALRFDGTNDYVMVAQSFLNQLDEWTLALRFNAARFGDGLLYSEGPGDASDGLEVRLTPSGQLQVGAYNQLANAWAWATTTNAPVRSNHWHQLAVTYSGGSDTNGILTLYLDDFFWQTNLFPRLNFAGVGQAALAAVAGSTPSNFFRGKLDMVRLWTAALTSDQIQSNRSLVVPVPADSLIAYFPFYEGQGDVVHDWVGGHNGSANGNPTWCYDQVIPTQAWSDFPGYIHVAEGNRYNINRYAYPTETAPGSASYVFGVNTGLLEVWWANRSFQSNMPAVYYPSRVVRYTNTWPANPPQIVIASGLGSSGDSLLPAAHALNFGSVTGRCVVVPSHAPLALGNELTVEAWVKLANPSDRSKIVSWTSTNNASGNQPAAGFNLNAGAATVQPEVWNDMGNRYAAQEQAIPAGVWTHIAFTYKAGDQLACFVNGLLVSSCSVANEPLGQPTGSLLMGSSYTNTGGTFGAIGDVRIWDIARSPADLAASFRTRLHGNEAGLLAYYPFLRGNDPTVLTDAGAFGLNGAIQGATWTSPGRPLAVPGPLVLGSPSIYSQNDKTMAGFNPNEEHALVLGGVAYALRNDLNRAASSEPFVLLDYLDPDTARPKMMAFSVQATNSEYTFEASRTAGTALVPIMPLGALPLCTNTFCDSSPPAWRDRKGTWWALSGGDDGGTANAVMRFYYQMQPTFYFPDLAAGAQPAIGRELPWLPTPASSPGTNGAPTPFVYHISWPDLVPELQLGQTLTVAVNGLPEVWNQLSVDVPYDQSLRVMNRASVTLFDPVAATGVTLDPAVINAMAAAQMARQDSTSSLIHFPNLPPSIYPRLYYDPNRGASGQLVLEGEYVSTLTGSGYLLLNLLEGFEKTQAIAMANALDSGSLGKWTAAVTALPGQLSLIQSNTPYVNAALGARFNSGVGYVTLAFNNSTNRQQVPPAQPITLNIIKVVPQLYSGDLEVIQPADALAEQLSLHYSADLAGQIEDAEFQWRQIPPSGGLIPNTNFNTMWNVYGSDPAIGVNDVSLSGASPFVMSDNYFAVRYRPTDQTGPSGTNWSAWTYNLAPGWVKRAMTGVNPFEQIYQDTVNNAVDTRVTMISQAGGPYEGDIALNLPAASSAGLIPTYETIFNRAKSFSIQAGLSTPDLNQTLLFAASRLRDLYTLLGDEAFADAQDPTIAFPSALATDEHGADATSIFCFMNQLPNLLEEELALLRGRDDTLEPSVHTSPIYNRLIWNFTQGINGGEAAYAYNYNLKGTPTNTVGVITADDAKRFYPQGHGDAWGHYLSAITHYYDLLANTNFQWQTTAESSLVGNATVSVDYLDEQKFAETAAARARTGGQIVKQTFRERYTEDPTGRCPGYTDSNTNRAWGIGDWASRAGQAAYYDWAVANSLMLDRLTNMVQVGGADAPPEGIQKIDRASTPELNEIAQTCQSIQSEADSANNGLNPLGLARNVVPFDIDPSQIDAGQTHFEQIYSRALQAVYNACVAFDHARNASLQLREQSDSTSDLETSLTENETDYHNRLIDLYGYPYPDDIGAGKTYPQGYQGPDLINWQLLDLENLLGSAPTGQVVQVQVYNRDFTPGNNFTSFEYQDYTDLTTTANFSSNNVGTISVCLGSDGFQVKPPTWASHRPAQGELQLALSDYVQTWYAFEAKVTNYNQTLAQLEVDLGHLQADYARYPNEWQQFNMNEERKRATAQTVAGLKLTQELVQIGADAWKEIGFLQADILPTEIPGLAGPFPINVVSMDSVKAAFKLSVFGTTYAQYLVAHGSEIGIESRNLQQAQWDVDLEELLKGNEYQSLLKWNTADTMVKLRDQYVQQAELLAQVEALSQSYQRVQKLQADGQLLLTQRAQVRARAAQRIQSQRYADLTFRIFRNDALRRYQQTFDLAARYTYLAAKAYDYETGLLNSDTRHTPGSRFLEDLVRARLPGRFYVWLGTPMVGGVSGEPGLADILARMKGDWDVVKGRFGFNNPDTETSRFSLRTELYRTSPSSNSDAMWAQTLENCKVANLHALPEFIRYCRPYTDITNVEPALVIPFSTSIVAGRNFFGQDLAGGDNAYDTSHQATKIRSAGIWFTNYNNTFNTNSGGAGLANEPRVYLIPIGQDVMRSPTRNGVATRSWTVLDQAIPLPYNVGAADVDNPDWIPVMNSLREPLAQVRRYDSLRAYHDAGDFDQADMCNNSRLVGRSVWNSRWLLIIPGRTLLADPNEGIERFIAGALSNGVRDGNGIKDIKIFFQTYSISGD